MLREVFEPLAMTPLSSPKPTDWNGVAPGVGVDLILLCGERWRVPLHADGLVRLRWRC